MRPNTSVNSTGQGAHPSSAGEGAPLPPGPSVLALVTGEADGSRDGFVRNAEAPWEERSEDPGLTRRGFLTNSILTVGGLIGVGYLALGVRYLFPNLSSRQGKFQDIGAASDFPIQSPTLKVVQDDGQVDGVYIVNMGSHFLALDFHCTHLNCPVTWYPGVGGAGRYICPCHGSEFTMTGNHVAGPAPGPLYRHQLLIQKGRVLVGGILS